MAAWLLGFAAVRAGRPEERDPYWQIRAGLENLAGVPLARPDTWTWAPVDGMFYPNSPGWNVMLGLSWRIGGYWGLFLLTFAVLAAYLGLAYAVGRKLGARPLPALAGLTMVILLGFPMLSGRATVAVQVELLAALAAPSWWHPVSARFGVALNGAAALLVGAAISTLGNWTHLSWLTLSPLVAVAWAVYWVLLGPTVEPVVSRARRIALIVAGTAGLCIGPLTSPYGLSTGIQRILDTQRICQGAILEWTSPFTAGLSAQWPGCAIVLLCVAGMVSWWLVHRLLNGLRDGRFALVACLGCVGLPAAAAGLLAIRFLGISVLTLAPVLAWSWTELATRARAAAERLPASRYRESIRRWTGGDAWRIVLSLVILVLLPGVIWYGPVSHAVPDEAAAVASLPTGCRLFGSAAVGGVAELIRPDVPVWFDGRADYFGRERLLLANAYYLGLGPTPVPPGTTCVVLRSLDSPSGFPDLTARIRADTHWILTGNVNGFDVWLRSAS